MAASSKFITEWWLQRISAVVIAAYALLRHHHLLVICGTPNAAQWLWSGYLPTPACGLATLLLRWSPRPITVWSVRCVANDYREEPRRSRRAQCLPWVVAGARWCCGRSTSCLASAPWLNKGTQNGSPVHKYDAWWWAPVAPACAAPATRPRRPARRRAVQGVPDRSHTVAAQGGIGASLGNMDEDNWHYHCTTRSRGPDWLGDQDAIEFMCREAPRSSTSSSMGMPFDRNPTARSTSARSAGMTNFGERAGPARLRRRRPHRPRHPAHALRSAERQEDAPSSSSNISPRPDRDADAGDAASASSRSRWTTGHPSLHAK